MRQLLTLAIIFLFLNCTECEQTDSSKTIFPSSEASYIYIKYEKNTIDKNTRIIAKFSSRPETEISDSSGYVKDYKDFINKKVGIIESANKVETIVLDDSGSVKNYENSINEQSEIDSKFYYKVKTTFSDSEANYWYIKYDKNKNYKKSNMNIKFSDKAETKIIDGSDCIDRHENIFDNKKISVYEPANEAKTTISDGTGYIKNYESFIKKGSDIIAKHSIKAEPAFAVNANYIYVKHD